MSTLAQFAGGGFRATTSIINACSTDGDAAIAAAYTTAARKTLSGALTANTLKTMLNLTGAYEVSELMTYHVDTTSRTTRLVVTVDGVEVFDATSAASTTQNSGVAAAINGGAPIRCLSTLVVEIASSITETDKIGLAYAYTKVQ